MRFFLARQRGDAPRPPPRPDDRRGRHTKALLAERRSAFADRVDQYLYADRPCGCDPRVHRVDYSDGVGACTGCGDVLEDSVLVEAYTRGPADGGNGTVRATGILDPHAAGVPSTAQSAPYRRENHLAELLKQATDTDPRIPEEDLDVIEEAFMDCHYRPTNGDTDAPYNFGPGDVRALIRALNDEAKVKKYSERWLQVKRYLCGEDLYDEFCTDEPLMPVGLCERIHARYRYFANAFEKLKRDGHPLFVHRHNIPNLNTVICHLLYQDDMENFHRYQWYFSSLDTLQSRLITECRIAHILRVLMNNKYLSGGFYWRYHSMLTVEDTDLFRENPERFKRILQQQIRQCQRHPRQSSTSRSTTAARSSISPCTLPSDGEWGPYSPSV